MTTTTSRVPRSSSAPAPSVRHRNARRAVGVLLVLLVAAIAVVLLRSMDAEPTVDAPTGPVTAPAGLGASEHIRVGDPDAPVVVSVYFDYLCPACGAFEAANGAELDRLLGAGDIQVELRPMAFLDDLSEGTEYSTRAANALATVADAAPDRVWELHTALYAEQPAEGEPGPSDEAIARLAVEAGVPADVADRFDEGRFEPWVASATAAAFEAGVEGTPTILVDGERFEGDPYAAGPLTEAVAEAIGDR